MAGQLGQTITYVTVDNNLDRAILVSHAPGAGAWWATIEGTQRSVRVAERTTRDGRKWRELR